MPTITEELARLTENTQNLLTTVNSGKIQLDTAVTNAQNAETNAGNSASSASTSASSASSSASTAQTAAAELTNYASMTSLERALPTKSEFDAISVEKRSQRPASGFDEFGKTRTGTGRTVIPDGMWCDSGYPNAFYMGTTATSGSTSKSKTQHPILNIDGVSHKFAFNMNTADGGTHLPPAPNVTHIDASDSGIVTNGKNFIDLSGWVVAENKAGEPATGRNGQIKLRTGRGNP